MKVQSQLKSMLAYIHFLLVVVPFPRSVDAGKWSCNMKIIDHSCPLLEHEMCHATADEDRDSERIVAVAAAVVYE